MLKYNRELIRWNVISYVLTNYFTGIRHVMNIRNIMKDMSIFQTYELESSG